MSDFSKFGKAVEAAFRTMANEGNVFVVDVSGDELWAHYLASFPEGSNPIFRTRTEYDCSCCKNFVRNIGGVVQLKANGKVLSVWDSIPGDPVFDVVAAKMAEFVKSHKIKKPFYASEPKYGSFKTNTNGEVWNHFQADVPRSYLLKNNPTNVVGERVTNFEVLKRSITEITDDAVEIVSDLIAQNSIYLGTTFKESVNLLKKMKREYAKQKTDEAKNNYLWLNCTPHTRFRNTVIGTLLTDLSEGVELDRAVASFEAKVAPTNYKRTTALVTDKMIKEAQKKVEALGIEEAFHRRYATKEDISVNNVLFVDGKVRQTLIGGVFDSVKPTKKSVPEFKNVDTIGIEDFIKNVLPKADEVELFLKSEHKNHFVSLIAPAIADSPNIFKWNNGFSWSYDGEVTDSIKERVKKAGGKVDGYMRVSLSWHNPDDLDLSVTKSGGGTVYFGNKNDFGATLDVDMNAFGPKDDTAPVENIVWADKKNVKPGTYDIAVHNYTKRSTNNVGFEVEVEIDGKVFSFTREKDLPSGRRVSVGKIQVTADSITVTGFVEGGSKFEKWGLTTETWVPVEMVMRSPNFWDDNAVGNQHVFFMLKDCKNPDSTRGFYNEFLRGDLNEHRKVFELLASKLKAPYVDNQLSGIGVSTTKKEELVVRVKGSVNRVLNVKF